MLTGTNVQVNSAPWKVTRSKEVISFVALLWEINLGMCGNILQRIAFLPKVKNKSCQESIETAGIFCYSYIQFLNEMYNYLAFSIFKMFNQGIDITQYIIIAFPGKQLNTFSKRNQFEIKKMLGLEICKDFHVFPKHIHQRHREFLWPLSLIGLSFFIFPWILLQYNSLVSNELFLIYTAVNRE